MQRGILYMTWGDVSVPLKRSIESVSSHHPELPVHICELTQPASLLDKATMFDLSPFNETLFLDVDTVVLGRLDFGFAMARKHGLACSLCEMPWARRYGGLHDADGMQEWNTGVLFFTRGYAASRRDVFQSWKLRSKELDSSIRFYGPGRALCVMPKNDQAAFALAVAECGRMPYPLSHNWNFRPAWHRSFWGPIKIWHDYSPPPQDLVDFSTQQSAPQAILEFREFKP